MFNSLFAKCNLMPFQNGSVIEARWSEANFFRFSYTAIFRNGFGSSAKCGELSNISGVSLEVHLAVLNYACYGSDLWIEQ